MKKLSTAIIILLIAASAAFTYRSSIDSYIAKIGKLNGDTSTTVGSSMPEIAKSIQSAITPSALKTISSLHTAVTSSTSTTLSIDGVVTLTNENRKENGNLKPLVENPKLDQSAAIKLNDMFAKQYFEHVSPSGVSITDLADKVSYDYIVIGENLAEGDFTSNKDLVDAWMASPGHRANILNSRYTEIGVAVGQGIYQGHKVWMAVQHFGMPTSACPLVDQSLMKKITDEEADLKTKENNPDAYNREVADIKTQIDTYNAQVNAFNSCAQE